MSYLTGLVSAVVVVMLVLGACSGDLANGGRQRSGMPELSQGPPAVGLDPSAGIKPGDDSGC